MRRITSRSPPHRPKRHGSFGTSIRVRSSWRVQLCAAEKGEDRAQTPAGGPVISSPLASEHPGLHVEDHAFISWACPKFPF